MTETTYEQTESLGLTDAFMKEIKAFFLVRKTISLFRAGQALSELRRLAERTGDRAIAEDFRTCQDVYRICLENAR